MNRCFKRLTAAFVCAVLLVTAVPLTAAAAALGDINNDGAADIMDTLLLYSHVAGETAPSEDETRRSDINGDGTVDTMDVLTLYQLIAGERDHIVDPPAVPAIREGVTDESVYMNKIVVKNTYTGRTFTATTKADLQMAVAEIVRYEVGMSTFGEKSDEAWKAMAVAAYTVLARHCYNGASYDIWMTKDIDLSNTTDKRIYDAVGEVLGIKLAYNDPSKSAYNQLCQVFYSASSAGVSCTTLNVWGYQDFDYLQPVESYYDNDEWIPHCSAGTDSLTHSFTISMDELKSCLAKWLDEDVIYSESKDGEYSLYATKQDGPYWAYTNLYYYTDSGAKKYVSGINIYNAVNRYGVPHCYSHAITVKSEQNGVLTIETKGNGHGIGMSQYGAAGYANEAGWTYDRILCHYFSVTEDSAWGLVGPKW